jgi:hypothetical protein
MLPVCVVNGGQKLTKTRRVLDRPSAFKCRTKLVELTLGNKRHCVDRPIFFVSSHTGLRQYQRTPFVAVPKVTLQLRLASRLMSVPFHMVSWVMRIELNCAVCGNNHFRLEHAQDDDALISCEDCGHLVGSLGQLKERVTEQVLTSTNSKSKLGG